jgi:phosphopantothenoylcysteine synthetase/decarboxylase
LSILITAGNTIVPIDRVRCITNIFTGRTGLGIALTAYQRGHHVHLLMGQGQLPEAPHAPGQPCDGWRLSSFQTFDQLRDDFERALCTQSFDAIIHCAAVSDYLVGGIYGPAPGSGFNTGTLIWQANPGEAVALEDCSAGKVKSDRAELWLRLVRAPKLVDLLRTEWKFAGILVKFKLEVDVADQQLLAIAERSRQDSAADLIVANTLEQSKTCAYLGPIRGRYDQIPRDRLPDRLLDAIEDLHRERGYG